MAADPATLVTCRRGRDHTVRDGRSSGDVARQRCRGLVSTSVELRSLHGETASGQLAAQRASLGFPGVWVLSHKKSNAVSTMLDLWMVPAGAGSRRAVALGSLSSTVRQTIFVIVCALNANVTLNCLGLDRPAGLTRYLVLPIRGKDLFLAKNVR